MSALQTMRAAQAAPPENFEIRDVPVPTPAAGEVRIRLEACGVCGSDLHFFGEGILAPGQIPGHEMVGRIDALGPGVSAPAVGTRVAVEPVRYCGSCRECLAGRTSVCRQFQIHGVTAHLPGGFSEYAVLPAQAAFPVSEDATAAVAAMAEPLAVAVHALRRGSFEPGQRVLILGCGSVGLTTLIAARAAGAGEVFISARHENQAKLAQRFGAHRVLREEEASPGALTQLGLENEFDLVVESVGGHADTVRAACAAVRPAGAVSVLGVFMGPIGLDPMPLLMKEVNLHWSNCYHHPSDGAADFAEATRIIADEHERLTHLTTHQYPLDRILEAFATAADKRSGAIKVSVLHGTD
jgi:threonine dehydrogenase-like Zn-dependent dehydrogenase